MKIPDFVKTIRYYVALSDKEAFSSWGTFDGAMASYHELCRCYPLDALRVIGIYQVSGDKKVLHTIK